MTETSYDVTNCEGDVRIAQTHQPKSKTAFFLGVILIFLVGVIIYLIWLDAPCYDLQDDIIEDNQSRMDNRVLVTEVTTPQVMFTEISSVPSTEIIKEDMEKMTCKSSECFHTAAHIISSMVMTKNPCENFYEYACGRMEEPNKEPLDIFHPKLFQERAPKFLKKFLRYYDSCLHHEETFDYSNRLHRTKEIMDEIGTFNTRNQATTKSDITDLIANMVLSDSMPLFQVKIEPDNTTFAMKFMIPDQTSLHLDHWSAISETKRKCLREIEKYEHEKTINMTILYNMFMLCQRDYGDFLNSISTAIYELNAFPNMTDSDIFTHIRDIRVFMEVDILSRFERIALPPNIEETNIKRQFVTKTIGQLKSKHPLIDWDNFLQTISNRNVSNETEIQLYNPEYFSHIFRLLTSEDPNLNNALLSILAASLYENTVLPSHKHTRKEYCQNQCRELMPDIVHYIYKILIRNDELKKSNDGLYLIYTFLRERFTKSLRSQRWLDEASKKSMISRLERIQVAMFNNDDILSEKNYLERKYESLQIEKHNYVQNHFNLIKFRKLNYFSLFGKEVTSNRIYRNFVDVTKAEPIYFYGSDVIYMPYELTRKVKDDLPEYVLLAQLGFPIAKTIGKAFDSIGIQYGVHLNENTLGAYDDFADETTDMLTYFSPVLFGKQHLSFNVNNDLSESERIADNTAMRLLTDSFFTFENQPLLPSISRDFSRERIFILYLTQGICRRMSFQEFMIEAYESPVLPPQLRIANILGNSLEFSKMFGCRKGSNMNRIKRRLQFPFIHSSKNVIDLRYNANV